MPRKFTFSAVLFLSVLVAGACHRRWSATEVAKLEEDRAVASLGHEFHRSYYTCVDGERGWDYVCDVRSEPTARGLEPGAHQSKPSHTRVALEIWSHAHGEPYFRGVALPLDGPVPSKADFDALQAERYREMVDAGKRRK